MSDLTPTPWSVEHIHTGRAVVRASNGHLVDAVLGEADVERWERIVRQVNTYDALLEALNELAKSFHDVVVDYSGDDPEEWESLNAADAAIALAEGETP